MNSAALSEIAGELLVTVRELREELIQVRPRVLYIFEKNTGNCLAKLWTILPSVANPDPGSGVFLAPGSVIQNKFFPDLISWIQELSNNFFYGKYLNTLSIGKKIVEPFSIIK